MVVLNDVDIFVFNDTATTEIYTLSLHDALPIYDGALEQRASARIAGSPPYGNACRPRAREQVSRWQCPARVYPGCARQDRKSTRLNSSHANISYAVFCLKKKIHHSTYTTTLSKL